MQQSKTWKRVLERNVNSWKSAKQKSLHTLRMKAFFDFLLPLLSCEGIIQLSENQVLKE
ncbi:MAG: hypothetical protein MUF58_07425 [Arcicella sp.]|nr:hypothetical protein [Arcicella sp.]